MEEIPVKIELPAKWWNVVIVALGHRPFLEVAEIINAIHEQAKPQLQPPSD